MNDKRHCDRRLLVFVVFVFLISSLIIRRDPLHTTVKKNIRGQKEKKN